MNRCNCENSACERAGDHVAGRCQRKHGKYRALYIGGICDACASKMPGQYLNLTWQTGQ